MNGCKDNILAFLGPKLDTKTLFASNFVLAMVVSERVLTRQFQGLFKSGPKNCQYNLKSLAK